ncbi:MAG TPA: TonB-dependent receptor [Chthoniobacterales bacterium]|nr:TonB-dependent receptor [Chthoniobacterales bacterium]
MIPRATSPRTNLQAPLSSRSESLARRDPATNWQNLGKARACCAVLLAIAVSRAFGQQATSEPVFVYGRDWIESVPRTDLEGDELTSQDKLAAAIQRVPNATINAAGANSYLDVYSIRGLGNTPNFSKQAVTLYLDGVPSSSTSTNFTELGELEQVTVFRGPQGDFFGKNSEAGVVEITTVAPGTVPQRVVAATVGSYDSANVKLLLAGPVANDQILAKIEGSYLSRDGFLENVFLGTRPDFQEHGFARGTFRMTPAEDWDFVFSAEIHRARDGVQRFVPVFAPDPFRVAFDFDGRTDIQGNVESLTISHRVEAGRLTFITSHRDWTLDPYEADLDYSPAPIVRGKIQLEQRQVAQEIRFESTANDAPWRYRVGLFTDQVLSNGTELFALPGLLKEIKFEDDEFELAIFGRATRRFGQAFELTGGMRLAYDTESITRRRQLSVAPATAFDSTRAAWNVQPRIALAYRCSEETSVYFVSTYGYKNSGFSYFETDPRLASFDRERVWSNEAGVRGDFFDHRLEVRWAGFVNRIEDYQVERPAVPPDITVFNAPSVLAWGGEMEINARPVNGLQLRAAAGYTHSEFREYRDPFTDASYRGNQTPFAPNWTASFEVRYSYRSIFAQAEVMASGQTFYDEANTAEMREGPHAQGNLRVGYEDNRFGVSVHCDNISDTRFFTQKITYAGVGTPAPPRTFGVEFRLRL